MNREQMRMDADAAQITDNMSASHAAKRLLYVLNYVDERDAQHFVHVLGLLEVLRKNWGWSIRLLSEKGGTGERQVLGQRVRYLSEGSRVARVLRLIGQLVKARTEGYRLVFVRISLPAMITAILVGRLIGLKTIFWHSSTNHDLDARQPFLRRTVTTAKLRFVSWGADRFVTGPEAMLRYYADVYRVPARKLTLLYNDIDLERFPSAGHDQSQTRPLRVLFVHSFSPSKNALKYMPAIIDRMNRAAAEGQRIEFDLAGDGPEREAVEAILDQAAEGVTVRTLGAVPNVSLPARYARADLFIMPSYREGMPRALMEAMATGRPAVATDAGGTRDIVGPLQAEYVVARDDHEAFADKMYELIRSPAKRQAIGLENATTVRRFSTDAVAEMYDRFLTGMLS